METRIFKPNGTDLASRLTAAELRRQLERVIDSGISAQINLQDVLSISESYADELFGILAEERGLDIFDRDIKISANKKIILSIAEALKDRLAHSEDEHLAKTVKTLLLAKRARELSADY